MKHYRSLYLLLLFESSHLVLIALSMFVSFLLRFDFAIPAGELRNLYGGLAVAVPLKGIIFVVAGLTRTSWRHIGIGDLVRIFSMNVAASLASTLLILSVVGSQFPRSVYCIDLLTCFTLTAGTRFALRLYVESGWRRTRTSTGRRILIYGAGSAGMTLLREIRSNPSRGYTVAGFLDDAPANQALRIQGTKVLGRGRDSAAIVDQFRKSGNKIDEIVIAMPSANGRQMQEALANCRAAGVRCKTIPGMSELLADKVLSAQIRDVSITDLVGRDPVQIEEKAVSKYLSGRRILVTGAAGSIGSELCRQVASFDPAVLVCLDQAESGLFNVDQELCKAFPSVKIIAEIGDIRDYRRMMVIIAQHQIEVIYHAAAYKHVPLMEISPLEAIRNNVLGTGNLVKAASHYGVASFVMISSDKAVNPTSVMGATKRVAELILSTKPQGRTKFVSVRFGNVLGSNGSVVPIFQAQIAAGGPVTVTHPEMRRYFMTIREAVQLVLLAGTMGAGSEVFVLDMGQPVRIVDIATTLIRLAGKTPGEDIEIRYVGLRPGEKLFEELNSDGNTLPTSHKKIFIFQGPKIETHVILEALHTLERRLDAGDAEGVIACLKELIPEYHPDPMWNPVLEKYASRVAAGGA